MMEDGGEHMAQPHSFSICTRGISSKSYISQKDRVSLHHLGIAPETLRAELTHFAYEHSVQRLTYLPQRTSLLGAANTRQVLQHYVAFSNKNDVSYYFNDTSCDWRVKHLVPMCLKASDTGLVLSSLFVSLHRLVSRLSIFHKTFEFIVLTIQPAQRSWLYSVCDTLL